MGLDWDPEGDRERRRETRNRVLLAIGITGALGAALVRTCMNSEAEKQRDRELQAVSRLQHDLDPRPSLSAGTPDPLNPPAASMADLESATRDVCKHLLACGGRTPAEVTAQLDACVTVQMKNATSGFARDLLTLGNRRVLDVCGSMSCDRFPSCYMETLQALAGGGGPSKPITPELRTKFTSLMCDVARENLGKVPDLHGPNPTPKMKELAALMDQMNDLATVSQLTKEVLDSGCAGH